MAAYTSRYQAETRSNIQKGKINEWWINIAHNTGSWERTSIYDSVDFCHHKSCMDKFRSMHGERAPRLVSDDAQNIMYDKAFRTTLASEISEPIFKDRSAFYITQLRDKYLEIVQGIGEDNVMSYRTDWLCKRLTDRVGNDVKIVPQGWMSSLVCSSSITVAELCVLATKLQKEVADSELLPEADDLKMTILASQNILDRRWEKQLKC